MCPECGCCYSQALYSIGELCYNQTTDGPRSDLCSRTHPCLGRLLPSSYANRRMYELYPDRHEYWEMLEREREGYIGQEREKHREFLTPATRQYVEEVLEALYPSEEQVRYYRRMPYPAYLQTLHWKLLREAVLKRDDYTCAKCGEYCSVVDLGKPRYDKEGNKIWQALSLELHCHHLTYVRRGCELLEDLQTLCSECHADEHNQKKMAKVRGKIAAIEQELRKATP